MKHARIIGCGVILATLGLGTVADAQQSPVQQVRENVVATATADTTFSTLTSALSTVPQTARRLARTAAISQTSISLVPVRKGSLTDVQRQYLQGSSGSDAEAQLRDAMSKATVATLDRPNGVSEDQVTLADFVQEVGIDPKSVLGVTFRAVPDDPQNPNVTVYYRQQGLKEAR